MTDHTRDVPPHQHGGTDAAECTTCTPTQRAPKPCACGCALCGEVRCPSCHNVASEPSAPDDLREQIEAAIFRSDVARDLAEEWARDVMRADYRAAAAAVWRDVVEPALAQRDAEIERLWQLSVINDPEGAWDTETARLHAELAAARRVIAAVETEAAAVPAGNDMAAWAALGRIQGMARIALASEDPA